MPRHLCPRVSVPPQDHLTVPRPQDHLAAGHHQAEAGGARQE